jgi:hypothetical protein
MPSWPYRLMYVLKIDKSAPTGTVSINDGASRTRNRSVTLTLSATDPSPGSGVSQMRISNTHSGLSSAPWEAYSTTNAWKENAAKSMFSVLHCPLLWDFKNPASPVEY